MPSVAQVDWLHAVTPNYLVLAPALIVVATMLVVMIADFYVKEKRALVWVTVSFLAFAMFVTWFLATDQGIQKIMASADRDVWGRMIVIDGFSFFMTFVLLGVAALVTLLSIDFVEKYLKGMFLEFYEVLLSATLGMMFMVSSRDLITIYIGLELTSICSYVLAGLLRKDPKSNEAALKYFLNGALASAILLFGLSIIYGLTGTTFLPDIAKNLGVMTQSPGMLSLTVAGVLFLAGGFAFKVAAVPMHLWAPDAYEGAPTPVTAFFSVGPKGAALGAILRIFVIGFGISPLTSRWSIVWAVLATASMFVGNITALMQTNIKRMMAYSSIAQAGYVLTGVVAASAMAPEKGVAAVMFFVMGYVLTNLGIFAILTHMDQEGQWVTVEDFNGLSGRNPFYAWALLICFISLIGIPPTVGFFGKFFLFKAVVDAGYLWLALCIAVNSVISVGYYYGVVKAMFLEKSDREKLAPSAGVMTTVIVSFAGVILAGILASQFLDYITNAAVLR